MANVDAASGFRPVRMLDGSPFNGQLTSYAMLAADATACWVGDVVMAGLASGVAGVFINGVNTEGMPTAIQVTTGSTGQGILGVVVGFLPDQTNLATYHRAASTNRIALVAPAQGVIYEVQSDEAASALVAADVNLNAAFTVIDGNSTTGQSKFELDSSTVNTTATLPLRIVGLAKTVGNAFNTAGVDTDNAKVEVVFNTYNFADNTVGI